MAECYPHLKSAVVFLHRPLNLVSPSNHSKHSSLYLKKFSILDFSKGCVTVRSVQLHHIHQSYERHLQVKLLLQISKI